MNYLNEYQTMKKDFMTKSKYKDARFPTYDKWVALYIQEFVLGGDCSPKDLVNIAPNYDMSNKIIFLQKDKQYQQKLSTRERLRKKLLEKKEKEMLKRL